LLGRRCDEKKEGKKKYAREYEESVREERKGSGGQRRKKDMWQAGLIIGRLGERKEKKVHAGEGERGSGKICQVRKKGAIGSGGQRDGTENIFFLVDHGEREKKKKKKKKRGVARTGGEWEKIHY